MPIDTAIVAVSNDAEVKARAAFASTQDAFDTVVTQINERVAFTDSPTLTTPILTAPTLTAPTVTGTLTGSDAIVAHAATAIPASGAGIAGVKFSSTPNFGLFFGEGVPAHSAAQGALYMRSDGSASNDRIYVNVDGGTTWTALVTVA